MCVKESCLIQDEHEGSDFAGLDCFTISIIANSSAEGKNAKNEDVKSNGRPQRVPIPGIHLDTLHNLCLRCYTKDSIRSMEKGGVHG